MHIVVVVVFFFYFFSCFAYSVMFAVVVQLYGWPLLAQSLFMALHCRSSPSRVLLPTAHHSSQQFIWTDSSCVTHTHTEWIDNQTREEVHTAHTHTTRWSEEGGERERKKDTTRVRNNTRQIYWWLKQTMLCCQNILYCAKNKIKIYEAERRGMKEM